MDFEQSDARRCSGPSEAIEVETRCSVMSVELSASSSAYSKSSKFLLFFEELRKIKPRSDLFYCLAKLRSGVILKIYFTPFVVSPAQSSPSDAKKTALRLFGLKVCKTWVCIDKDLLPTFSQPSSGPAPREETKWTVSRQLQPAHNYRFNVSSGTSEINNKHLRDELVSETAAGGGWQHSREPDPPQLCTRKNPEFWPVVELDRTSKAKAPHSNTKTQNLHQTSSAKVIQRSMATAYDSSNLLAANIESLENSLGFAGHFIFKAKLCDLKEKPNPGFSFPSKSNIDSNCEEQPLNSAVRILGQPAENGFGQAKNSAKSRRESAFSGEPASSPYRRCQLNSLRSGVQASANVYNRNSDADDLSSKSDNLDGGKHSLQLNPRAPARPSLYSSDQAQRDPPTKAQTSDSRANLRDAPPIAHPPAQASPHAANTASSS